MIDLLIYLGILLITAMILFVYCVLKISKESGANEDKILNDINKLNNNSLPGSPQVKQPLNAATIKGGDK